MKKFRWPFVKRTTFESTVRSLKQSNDNICDFLQDRNMNEFDEHSRQLAKVQVRCINLAADLEKEQTSRREFEETLLDLLRTFVPIRWEPQYHRGYYVTDVCKGEHCKHPHQNGKYVYGDFSKLVREVMERIASGWRPSEDYYCRDCTPFPVEKRDGKWRVVTTYCGYGGCDAQYQDFDSEPDAQAYAKKLYDSGRRVNWNGLCSECASSYYEDCM